VPEIKHQQLGGNPKLEKSEIHIPNDSDMGTGTFTTVFKPKAFKSNEIIVAGITNPPVFQIDLTINRNGDIPVLLGKADGSPPAAATTFRLPQYVSDASHTIVVEFVKWHILAAVFDGKPMALVAPEKTH
jgi:hypothetical protein